MAAVDLIREVADPYSRRARLFPGFIVMLPISLLAVVLVTTKPTWWSAIILVVGGSGASYLGAQLVRGAGRRKEPELWDNWGGAPTTQMLRFRTVANRLAVQRRHYQLARLLPDLSIPDEAGELADPKLADQAYEIATRALIERTRANAQFDRIFDELCQYGFRRNLWGCRNVGLWLAAGAPFATVIFAVLGLLKAVDVSMLGLLVSGGADVVLLLILGVVVRKDWVRESAEAYALHLMSSLETLTSANAAGIETAGRASGGTPPASADDHRG